MDEYPRDETPRQYDETTNPRNPPGAMLHPDTRRAAVWSYFVPVVVLFVVVGIALLYWSNRPAHSDTATTVRSEVGTVGSTEGGFDPQPRPGNTRDEVNRRGDDLAPVTRISELHDVDGRTMSGRRVALTDVQVDSIDSDGFWLRDDDEKFAVIAPTDASVKPGMHVDVSGRIEAGANGGLRIRADRVQGR